MRGGKKKRNGGGFGGRRLVVTISTIGLLLTFGLSCYVLLQIAGGEPAVDHAGGMPQLRVQGQGSERRGAGAFTKCPDGRSAKIDDNFCDCRGCSDLDTAEEARTSACSFDTVGVRVFHCKRDPPGRDFIFSSRVNDGVHDCCDCSDEGVSGGAACPNRCPGPAQRPLAAQQRLRTRERGRRHHGGETRRS